MILVGQNALVLADVGETPLGNLDQNDVASFTDYVANISLVERNATLRFDVFDKRCFHC